MSQDTPISLVPGDDWDFDIQTLDENGAEIDLTGFTVLKRSVTGGIVSFDVDVVLAPGVAHITAGHAVTAALRMGNVSTLTIQVQSPDTLRTTILAWPINGVKSQRNIAVSAQFPGIQGQPGINWRDDINEGEWLIGTVYSIRDGVFHDPSSFRAIATHTSDADTEPEVGADWRDVWRYVSRGGGGSTPAPPEGTFDFSQPQNSGLLALLEDI